MREEVCLFHKFGFCRKGDNCRGVHLREVCSKRECDSRTCNKRHPRPCKFFRNNDFCKFNSKCSYSHSLPKYVSDQNMKVEDLERKTGNLHKQITEQNETIRVLRNQLFESQKREVDRLQQQISDLKAINIEKEQAIKKLDEKFCGIKEKYQETECPSKNGDLEKESEEEDLELKEDVDLEDDVGPNNEFKTYRTRLLKNLNIFKEEVKKLRSTYTQRIKSKVKMFNESMQEGKEIVTNDTFLEVLKTFADYENTKKIVKDDLIADIIFAIDDIHNDT